MYERHGCKSRRNNNYQAVIRGGNGLIERSFILKDKMGLHARPAARLMMEMLKVRSSVEVRCKGDRADGKDVLSIMALNTTAGDEVLFCIDGPDEEDAMREVESILKTV